MLRNRSRVMTGKQALMADGTSMASPTQSNSMTSSVSSFLASPRIFSGLLSRTLLSEPESAMSSPTSILDAKPFSNFVNPFVQDPTLFKSLNNHNNPLFLENKHAFEKVDGVGLAIVDSLSSEKNDPKFSDKPSSKMVLFGAKLKVQIPPPPPPSAAAVSPAATPKSPGDFGIKTRNAHFFCPPSGFGSSPLKSKSSPREMAEGLSLSEMELSEDYTCVITHGPNPKTIHIFDDCVVENCCGVVKLSELGKDCGLSTDHHQSKEEAKNFLKACDSCKNSLGPGKDVFMYRGEKAFCSHECRSQEMMVAEGVKNSED